jgi:uncharacterized protein
MITKDLITAIRSQFRLDWPGVHGISHWSRVYDIGMKLSDQTGAHRSVVQLFSIFHDSGRCSEGADPEHGLRGAELAQKYRNRYLRLLTSEEFDLLHTACRLHTSASTHEHITIQTCFDSDRLDLGRVGTIPDPKYLCTDAAKSADMISWALANSEAGRIPDNLLGNFASESTRQKN